MAEEGAIYVSILAAKHLTRSHLREEGFLYSLGRDRDRAGIVAGWRGITLAARKQRAARKHTGLYKTSKPAPSYLLHPARLHPPPKGSARFPNSATHWGPSVQTQELMGDTSHSNHNR